MPMNKKYCVQLQFIIFCMNKSLAEKYVCAAEKYVCALSKCLLYKEINVGEMYSPVG